MEKKHVKTLIRILTLRHDFREILTFSFYLTLRKSILKPVYRVIFYLTLFSYSKTLKTLEIEHKNNIFVTHKVRRLGLLNLDKICQNILVIDQNRIARRRKDFKAIYYNLHKPTAKGLVVKQLLYEEIKVNVIKVIFANSHTPYIEGHHYEITPHISSKFFEINQDKIVGISVYDPDMNLLATSIGFFTDDIFNIEFLVSVYGNNSQVARWVLHEAIVDLVHARNYKYIRISNYFTTSIKNIYFNRRLGYEDFNLL
jgi:hypothetical protein